MKHTLIILTLLTPLLAFGQYPASPTTKVDLGRQTTGDGLTFRTSGVPSWTPTGKNNAWMALDTVANVLYLYDASAAEWLPVSSERTLYPVVKNVSAGTLAAGTVVAVDETDPATGDKLNVVAAEGDGTKPAKLIVGVLVQSLAASAEGRAAWFGVVKGLSLPTLQPAGETWAEGDILYLSGSVNGGLTKNEPARPALDIAVAVITRISGNNLTLLVRPQLGEKLSELHDVSIAGVTNGQVLTYNDTTGLWVARTQVAVTDGDKGDITVSSSGATWNIDAGVVGSTEIADSAVVASKLPARVISEPKLAFNSVGANQLISTGVTPATYNFATVTVDTDGRITSASSGTPITDGDKGDITVSASGATWTVDNAAIINAKLGADAVTTDKIAAGAVQESDIGSGAVTATKIGTGAVGATQLASTTVAAGSYTAANITVDEDGRLTSAASNTSVLTGTGVNTRLAIWNGTSTLTNNADLIFDATAKAIGLGASPFALTGYSLRITSPLTGANPFGELWGVSFEGTYTTGSTSTSRIYNTFPSFASNVTLADFTHYIANVNTIGTNVTVANQYGFRYAGAANFATNNYAYFSTLAAGTGRWNLYMQGTANNYLAGNTTIGTLTTPTTSLFINTTDAIRLPTGTTAQRPSGVQGFLRYNTTTMELDIHDGTNYRRVVDIADATPNTGDVVSWTGSAFSAVASRRGVVTGTPDGSGDLTLTFGTAMPDATYSATATAEGTTAYIITVHNKATGSVKFRVFNDAGTAVTSGTITVNYQITDY